MHSEISRSMNMSNKYSKIVPVVALAVAGAMSMSANAATVSVNAGFTVIENFEGFDGLVTSSPVALGGGTTAQTTDVLGTYGVSVPVDLANNGAWGPNRFFGTGDLFLNSSSDYDGSVTFSWGVGHFGAGADFSIYQPEGETFSILLEALSSTGAVLESHTLLVDFDQPDSYNLSTFAGFLRTEADIYGLRATGDGLVLDNLAVAPVPVPAALPLLLSGLAGLGAMARRRRRAVA
jgi:hypothetical protein